MKERKIGEVERCIVNTWKNLKKIKICIRRKELNQPKKIVPKGSQSILLKAFDTSINTSNIPDAQKKKKI